MRRALVIIGVVVTAAAVALGVWFIGFRDTATPAERPVGAARPGAAPGDPGVYTFATEGFEEIDAFAGARHDYPAQTFFTVAEGECGPTTRWDALDERWIQWDHCGEGFGITRTQNMHQWFGVTDLEDERCETSIPLVAGPGEPTATSCIADETTETYRAEVLGTENVVVGGETVETIHVRVTSHLEGESVGESVAEYWYLPDTVLPVKVQARRTSTTASPIGDVHYVEEYTLLLARLLPA